MKQVFGKVYSDLYDVFYHDKDYEAECDLIEQVFHKYGDGGVCTVLDLGCGTGNHVIPLARRCYKVVGVDYSEAMLAHARKKAAGLSENPPIFYQGDIRWVHLGQQFDTTLMMFAVLSYQLENADVLAALRVARRHLRPGGLLIFDVWYGPAVLHQRPSDRIKVIPTSKGQVLRVSSSTLDIRHHCCTVHYRIWKIVNGRLVTESEEEHIIRYFFPLELEFFLESAGFTLVRLGAFPNFDREPSEETWNVMGVARAI